MPQKNKNLFCDYYRLPGYCTTTPCLRVSAVVGQARTQRGPAANWQQGLSRRFLAPSYSSTTKGSTIGAAGLNGSVRNGKRCDPRAISTRKPVLAQLAIT